ncbi:unannotated protein [freshwater metagenome]|uniref:Unannotated protein n=1 Tax=freshwater metagenome TaxID=449393 RepID=A0A6J6Z5G1_9ZZZZ
MVISGPASRTSTDKPRLESRSANTQPADPAPITMTSGRCESLIVDLCIRNLQVDWLIQAIRPCAPHRYNAQVANVLGALKQIR